MRAYIKAVFTDICALSVESHYEYQYEPMERKHRFFFFFFFFSLGYSCTQEIYSSQSNGQSEVVHSRVNSLCSTSLSLSPALSCGSACITEKHFVSSATVANTTIWKSDRAKRSHKRSNHYRPTVLSVGFGVFSHSLSSSSSSSSGA